MIDIVCKLVAHIGKSTTLKSTSGTSWLSTINIVVFLCTHTWICLKPSGPLARYILTGALEHRLGRFY